MSTGMYETYYNVDKATRWGVKESDGNTPKLVFGFANGNPRMTVFLGKDKGSLWFPSDYATMGAIVESLLVIMDKAPGARIVFDSKKDEYIDNKPTGNVIVRSKLTVGKAKNGAVYIRIEEKDKPKAIFPLTLNEWHGVFDETEERFGMEAESRLVTLSMYHTYRGALNFGLEQYTKDAATHGEYKPVPIDTDKNKNSGGKGNYNNKGNYNKGNYNKGAQNTSTAKPDTQSVPVAGDPLGENGTSYDEDIPF